MESFIDISPDSHFPIQNLPYGVCRPKNGGEAYIGTPIGDYVLNLAELDAAGVFDGPELDGKEVFRELTLNKFMSLGHKAWAEARSTIRTLLDKNESSLRDNQALRERVLISQENVEMMCPVDIGDYTDFYSSEQHAINVGTMFRGADNALKPNWKHLPVGYHGRSSSVVISGTDLHRPRGQILPPGNEDTPVFESSKLLDFELELGFFTGPGNSLGDPISVKEAHKQIFGFVLVNDWSARDIQKWEYEPLGPFLAKNWATSISPWVVPLAALERFRVKGPEQNPEPLPYLRSEENWNFDINLEVYLQSEKMKTPHKVSATNAKNLYWDSSQQLAHQSITGCNVQPGDLYASGTISGRENDSYGSMLELSWKGEKPLEFPNGEQRTFLEDGDRVIMTGYARGDGYRVGFGELTGKVLPAKGS